MHQTYASKGMCNAEHNKPGIFRRKSSTSSMRSQHQQLQSSLVVSSGQSIKSSSSSITQLPSPSPSMAQLNAGGSSSSTTPAASCPTSPQRYYGSRKYTRSINELKQQTSLPASSTTSPIKLSSQNSSSNINNNNNNTNGTIKSTIPYSMSSTSIELHRSTSTVSGFRYRSNPTGLYSYTGSAPPSVHGSRIDLNNISTAAAINSNDKGSAIYLGCTPRQKSNINALSTTSKSSSSSSWSVNRSSSIGGTVGTVGGGGRGGDGTSIVGTSTSGIRGSVTNNSNINRNRSSSATKLQSNTPPISPKHTRTRRPPSAPSSMAQSRKT